LAVRESMRSCRKVGSGVGIGSRSGKVEAWRVALEEVVRRESEEEREGARSGKMRWRRRG
jgi:hypothetical protein